MHGARRALAHIYHLHCYNQADALDMGSHFALVEMLCDLSHCMPLAVCETLRVKMIKPPFLLPRSPPWRSSPQ
jgi:hypothetical protein